MRSFRRVAVLVHRYVGLAMAAFLLVAGLTGSMMAFYTPLDRWLNPELFIPKPGKALLDPFVIQEKVNAQLPPDQARHGVALRVVPDETLNYWVDGRETFVDPYTGAIVGSRKFGDWREKKSILTFFYELHFTLGLGEVGRVMFGVVALLWTLDCFVGAYLTFPLPAQRAQKSWFKRWLPMWRLNTSKLFAAIFSWHRASGLWVWLMLLIFAWSAVALTLEPVYEPVTKLAFSAFGDYPTAELPTREPPLEHPPISLREAHRMGRTLMAREAAQRGFRVIEELGIDWLAEHGAFTYSVESTLDISQRMADTAVAFTPEGKLLRFSAPTREHAGLTFTSWIVALHFGAIRLGGTPYRAFVCAMGIAVALLAVSGVWIWWKKRR